MLHCWILQGDTDGAVRARLDEVFAEEEARWATPASGPELAPALIAQGLLDDGTRARELRRGWDEVIAPSWASAA